MGSSKKQTIGYKYYLGMHLGLCHGPIDKITRLEVDQRIAWTGDNTGTPINLNAEELFGGSKREGGVSGTVDVEMGRPTQTANSYLVSKLGALVPAYRGVVGLVFRQAYLGNNPYLKRWSARGQRIHVRQDGIAQWYDAKAEISENSVMTEYVGSDYWPHLFQGNPGYIPAGTFSPTVITIGPFAQTAEVVAGSINGAVNTNPDDYLYFNDVRYGSVASAGIPAGTVMYVLPAGQTVTVKLFNLLNNECGMGGAFHVRQQIGLADMNPAHIIRECLTDPEWGMGYTDDDIDDVSFMQAADLFYEERLGMSLLWDRQVSLDEFIQMVLRHVDAALYVSRTTGKYVLTPIRGGYDVSLLLTLNESNISQVDDPVRISFGELTNSVTVKYWDQRSGKDGSITIPDTALIQQQGAMIGATVQYLGFSNARNATIAAQRDLRSLSSPLLSCTITADSDARGLNIGDVFKFSWAKWGLVNVVMRVTGISYGTGRNRRVKINCTEDVFDTNTTVVVVSNESGWVDPNIPPTVVPEQLAVEAPYYELVQSLGQADVDNKLLTHPEIGYVIAAAGRPGSAINASVFTDDGSGFEDAGTFDFCAFGYLTTAIAPTQGTFVLENFDDLDQVDVGTHVQIGQELMRVDSVNTTTGEVTVGRGILDTVPQAHLAGEPALFWDVDAGFDPTEYVLGEEVGVKVVPISGAGVLPIGESEEMTVQLSQRAFRPYPPGNLQLNGESYTPGAVYLGSVAITWAHRNRLEQTGGTFDDYSVGNIGPEALTLYRVQGYINDVLVHTEDDIAGTSASWLPVGTSSNIRIEVHSKRDSVYSWQGASHTFSNDTANTRITEDGDVRITMEGDVRVA